LEVNYVKKVYAIFVCLLFIGTMFVAAAAVAPKPDKPPKPDPEPDPGASGTIYYHIVENNEGWIYTMNADGSQKTKQIKTEAGISSLSYEKHGEHYWWIGYKAIDGQTYPDDQPRQELMAIRDDKVKSVQLTNDATMGFSQYCWKPRWGFGDGFISWAAKKWVQQVDSSWAIDESGIFKQSISFDTNGDVTGLTGSPTLVYDPGLIYVEYEDFYMVDSDTHNWAPDNNKFVNCEQDGEIYIIDLTQPVGSQKTYLTTGGGAEWSPDGTKITFIRSLELRVIDADGSNEKVLVEGRHVRYVHTERPRSPTWAPDSNYICYTMNDYSYRTYNSKTNIFYIKSNGKENTCLTKSLDQSVYKNGLYWR
jgi:hypothetical protein